MSTGVLLDRAFKVVVLLVCAVTFVVSFIVEGHKGKVTTDGSDMCPVATMYDVPDSAFIYSKC